MKRSPTVNWWSGLAGLGLGALLFYWWDPQTGRRRRAQIRDRATRAAAEATDAARVTARDLKHRGSGLLSRFLPWFSAGPVDDAVLAERARSALGRVCSHPGAIDVDAREGVVELRGPILKSELKAVLRRIGRIRGVKRVENRLEPQRERNDVPALQGGTPREKRWELAQTNWAPGPRLVVGIIGLGLLAYGLRRRGPFRASATLLGLGALARSATNLELKRLTGIGAGRRAIDVVKDINIQAPVEEVFSFWEAVENFPRFMSHVKEVRPIGEERYHWKVEGPGGAAFEWDAEITRKVPGRFLAWRSVRGAAVQNAGYVRFERQGANTRLTVRLSYNPPGGAMGHAVAKLLGSDPKKQLDDDLLRLKSLIEEGKTRGAREQVTREEIGIRTPRS